MIGKHIRLLSVLAVLYIVVPSAWARSSVRSYTAENPLIYEDSWNLWPYVFISYDGQPAGFYIDLLDYIFHHLHIPYETRLCASAEAHSDLLEGKADLSIGVKSDFNSPYGEFGEQPVVNFTHSMLSPRRDSLDRVHLSDLDMFFFSVHEGSLSHHYLSRKGFDQQMQPVDDMQELVRLVGSRDSGIVVWNTLSLKWLRHKYHLENLTLSAVDIPDGAFHFMSNDTRLLHRLDSMLVVMRDNGQLDRIASRWLYPEKTKRSVSYIWINVSICLIAIVLLVVLLQYIYYYRRSRSGNSLRDVITEMGLVLTTADTEVWTYDPSVHRFSWMNNRGESGLPYRSDDFSCFYEAEAMTLITSGIEALLSGSTEEVELSLRATVAGGMKPSRPVQLRMLPLRDEYLHIYMIVGLQREGFVSS